MKSNPEAELTILKYLCKNYDPSYVSLIKPEWFYNIEHKAIFNVLSDFNRQITYAELTNALADKFPTIKVDSWVKNELFRSNEIETGEAGICVDIIEEKYQLRLFEDKLTQVHSRMFSTTLADIQTELISYFHNTVSNKDPIKKLDEDFQEQNTDLVEFGNSRPQLNRLNALRDTVITIGGDSSHHKTNQLLDILIRGLLHNYPKNPEFKVMMFSGEMSWKRIRDRIFAKMLHIELDKITKRQNIKTADILEEFNERYPQIRDNFILVPPTQFRSVNDLSRLVIHHKPDIWGLDFLQYFAQMSSGNNAEMQNKNVMEAIATIKVLVEVTNSLAVVLSQLRKRSEQRQLIFPRIDDLEWSGLTKQISDVVGLCFWPYKINPSTSQMNWYTVSWQKVRDGDPFNEVLWVDPQFCDFKPHPTPNAERKYFEW